MRGATRSARGVRAAKRLVVGVVAIALVTVAIAVLEQFVRVLGLAGLYLFAIVPIAIAWGFWPAALAAVASYLAFEYFFVAPVDSFRIADADTATALVAAIVTAYFVSGTAHGRAREARLRAEDVERAQNQLRRVADEQAALRRVATRVALGEPPSVVLAAVAQEVGRVVPGADVAGIGRYESPRAIEFVGGWTSSGDATFVGDRVPLGGRNVMTLVFEGNAPARVDELVDDAAPATVSARTWARCSAGAPISVDGRLWGAMIVGSPREDGLPPGIEHRVAEFTDLIAIAIANAQAREDLMASRARVVASADEARRRIERDLHDGAQQRIVAMTLKLRAARETVPAELGELAADIDHVASGLEDALDELRELGRGIHPSVLAKGGLGPALTVLARRCPVPVELDLRMEGALPEPVAVAAYYTVSEALTNVARHSRARTAAVHVELGDGVLRIAVSDDGVGGADGARGSGLVGLKDRVEALGGRIAVVSPRGGGTSIHVELATTGAGGAGRGRRSIPAS